MVVLVDGLNQIRDTNWAHNDPVKTLEKMAQIPPAQLLKDILTQSRVVEASMILYTAPIIEFCLEVARYCNTKKESREPSMTLMASK